MPVVIGVDVGGTFTDFFIYNSATTEGSVFKVASSPEDPAKAIVHGLKELLRSGRFSESDVSRVSHGTTVGTNTLIQRSGASVALVTTKGFRDLLEIGRQNRPHLYNLQIDQPEVLVPRKLRLEAPERVLSDGTVLEPLQGRAVTELVNSIQSVRPEAVAICFLFSYLNPAHEQMLRDALNDAGYRFVSASSDVQPEFREFERMSTTVLNAYLQPVMADYLKDVSAGVTQLVSKAALRINQSSGGLMSASQAARYPVRTALSGPAAGVVAAADIATTTRRHNLITLDMGGTSADVSLITDSAVVVSYEGEVGGFPVRLPMVDVNAVGAGGGSIAWIARDGLLKVGPKSAGATPGPACYGQGGEAPTVTDANLILGRLSPRGLLDGELELHLDKARAAFADLARNLEVSVERAALGCLQVVVANMVRAIRSVSVERGHDPEHYALLAFGGGGPLHARDVASSLGISEVIIPEYPGILCAQGLLVSDISESLVSTFNGLAIPEKHEMLLTAVGNLLQEAELWYRREYPEATERQISVSLDVRYVGQNYELSLPIDSDELRNSSPEVAVGRLNAAFHNLHAEKYGVVDYDSDVEIVNIRVQASIPSKIHIHRTAMDAAPNMAAPVPQHYRSVYFTEGGTDDCPVYQRHNLVEGCSFTGPTIIEQLDSTTLVHPGDKVRVDEHRNLIIRLAK